MGKKKKLCCSWDGSFICETGTSWVGGGLGILLAIEAGGEEVTPCRLQWQVERTQAQETREQVWLYLRGAGAVRGPGVGATESCPGPCGAGDRPPPLGVRVWELLLRDGAALDGFSPACWQPPALVHCCISNSKVSYRGGHHLGLNCHTSRGWKSDVGVTAWRELGGQGGRVVGFYCENPCPGCHTADFALCLHVTERQRGLWGPLYKGPTSGHGTPRPQLTRIPKDRLSNSTTWR